MIHDNLKRQIKNKKLHTTKLFPLTLIFQYIFNCSKIFELLLTFLLQHTSSNKPQHALVIQRLPSTIWPIFSWFMLIYHLSRQTNKQKNKFLINKFAISIIKIGNKLLNLLANLVIYFNFYQLYKLFINDYSLKKNRWMVKD